MFYPFSARQLPVLPLSQDGTGVHCEPDIEMLISHLFLLPSPFHPSALVFGREPFRVGDRTLGGEHVLISHPDAIAKPLNGIAPRTGTALAGLMQTSGATRFLFFLFTTNKLSPMQRTTDDMNGQKALFWYQISRIPDLWMLPRCDANIVWTTRDTMLLTETNGPSLCSDMVMLHIYSIVLTID